MFRGSYKQLLLLPLLILLVTIPYQTVFVKAAYQSLLNNQGSYMFGYDIGKIDGTFGGCIIQNGVTNATACADGYFSGYKNWCINHAKDCVENFNTGDFPEMILKAHQQYLLGNESATGNSMCPIGENAAFCDGWENNNDDYGGQDCSDSPLANISYSLMGCAQDIMTVSQIGGAGLHTLVGSWNYVNQSKGSETMTGTGISGKIVYGANGDFNLTIPLRSPFGNYTLEGAWGYIGHNILTECYAGGCENNTLTTVTLNHVEFLDNNGNTIRLMLISPSSSQPAIVPALTNKGVALDNLGNYTGAIEYYDKALAIDPRDVPALTNKGLALYNLGNHTGAIEYYDKALAINPKDTTASAGLSRAEDAYSRGYSDAVADAHYAHGHGYDSSCPSGHSAAYCQNYKSGYATGWLSVTTKQTQGGVSKTVTGPNGITAKITAPPGSVINSVRVTPLIFGVNDIDFTGTWAITTNPKSVPTHNITGIPTITFDGFMHNVCCWNHKEEQVYLQPFTAYVGHSTFKGYWEDLSFFNRPNTLQLCANSTDVKHFVGLSPILSNCTSMTVKIVNNNHVELLNPAVDTMHLIRLEKHLVPGSLIYAR